MAFMPSKSMRLIRSDLWESRLDTPYPGVTTHAYLWTGGPDGNVLFYGTQTDADYDEMESLGGVAHQYLSHRDEAGPMLARTTWRFGTRLHAPARELVEIGQQARRRQRHRGHPHPGSFPWQHVLPGARGEWPDLPVHR